MNQPANRGEMRRTISVAIIEPIGGHSGAHYYDFGLCRGLLAAGCRVTLYTCDETTDPVIPGLTFHPFYRRIYGQNNRSLRGLRYLWGTFASLTNAVASGETVCHFQVFNDLIAELTVIAMAKLLGRTLVLTVHDVDSLAECVSRKRKVTAWIYRLADRIIVHNNASMKELEVLGVPSAMIAVIPHGHYLDSRRELTAQDEAKRACGIVPSAKVVLFFGQIKDAKGLDILIDALPQVAYEIPDVILLIAGRPWKTEFTRYAALIEELKVGAYCRLNIGFVPDEEVASYFSAADLVALPYRRIYQSGVLMMAMTYGRPVVVSDLPGMTEVVSNGVNGYVFKQGSSSDLARALIRGMRDAAERKRIASRASEYIRKHHDWNRIGQSTKELYEAVLAP
jgi:glycosyltransferase involved in cell wall biosynthesis